MTWSKPDHGLRTAVIGAVLVPELSNAHSELRQVRKDTLRNLNARLRRSQRMRASPGLGREVPLDTKWLRSGRTASTSHATLLKRVRP